MAALRSIALLLLLTLPIQAQDKTPAKPADIRFPTFVAPAPPVPVPAATPVLDSASLYVIDADVPVMVLASPGGLVKISEDVGPMVVMAKFIDSAGIEKRTFKGKQLFFIEAAGVGKCELIVIPVGATKVADVIRKTIDVNNGQGPQPPPVPPEPKPPTPDVKPPIPESGFRVMILEDKKQLGTLPEDQLAIRTSAEVRAYLNSHCVQEQSGTKAFRIWDVTTDARADLKVWQDALQNYRQRRPLPWIIISDGKTGYEGPLPKNIAETMDLLKKYGGN